MRNTIDFVIGNYTIRAHVQPLIDEAEIDDDTFKFHFIHVIPEFPLIITLLPFMLVFITGAIPLKRRR